MKTNNRIFLFGLCALMCSCAALGKYKPETEVSETLYGDAELSDTSLNIANFKWQDVFKDPYLVEYIDTAIVHNLDYQAALEHIQQAQAQLLGAKLAYIPTLGISGSFSPSFYGTNNFNNTSYDYSLNAVSEWQLDFVRKTNNLRMSKATVAQAEDYRQAVLSQLIAAVANNYYTLLMLDAQLDATTVMLSNWKESVETIKVLKDCGEADQVAVSQYEANYDDININYLSLVEKIEAAENSMSILLGKEIERGMKRGKLIEQNFDLDINIGIPVQMLTLRPDVRAAQRDMELAFYTTKGALLNFFPTLSLNGSIGMIDPATGALSPITLLANVGAGLVAPILSAGQNRSAYKAAQSRQRESRLMFDKTLLEAGTEVNDALCEYKTCTEKCKSYYTRVKSLERAYEDTEYLMRNSFDKTYLDVLYANTNFFQAKLAAIENQSKRLQAAVNLYSALGGGTIE